MVAAANSSPSSPSPVFGQSSAKQDRDLVVVLEGAAKHTHKSGPGRPSLTSLLHRNEKALREEGPGPRLENKLTSDTQPSRLGS